MGIAIFVQCDVAVKLLPSPVSKLGKVLDHLFDPFPADAVHHHKGLLIVIANPWILIAVEDQGNPHALWPPRTICLGIENCVGPGLSVIDCIPQLSARKIAVGNLGMTLRVKKHGIPLTRIITSIAIDNERPPDPFQKMSVVKTAPGPVPRKHGLAVRSNSYGTFVVDGTSARINDLGKPLMPVKLCVSHLSGCIADMRVIFRV